MYLLYSLLLAVGFALALPYYLWKGRASGKYVQTFRERWDGPSGALRLGSGEALWIHAVSVGEVLAVRPLLRALRGRLPGRPLLLSTTTLTGQAIARRSVADLVDGVFYAPFDFRGPVRRVLERVDPAMLVLVETELWPNLIHETRRRGARVAVVNGRLSARSTARYRRIRVFLRTVLAEVDLFAMQAEAHARRAVEIGAPAERVRVLGNLKYDALEDPEPTEALSRLVGNGTDSAPLWIAGSTAAGEEPLVLAAFGAARRAHPGLRLLIAPRHPERFEGVCALVEAAGLTCVRRSQLSDRWSGGDVLVLDTLGDLARAYPLASVVFVGGSLVPFGGHNVLEAAVAAKAIVVGPHMEHFQEMADEFLAAGGLIQVRTAHELGETVSGLLSDPGRCAVLGQRAHALIDERRGAAARTAEALAGLLA